MKLTERCVIRISKFEKNHITKNNINVSMLFRTALNCKIRDISGRKQYSDDIRTVVSAWNVVSNEVCSALSDHDLELIRDSEDRRIALQQHVAGYLSPKSLEHFAIFLQGGRNAEQVIASFFDFPPPAPAIAAAAAREEAVQDA